jgi:TPP-dependent pyruvate/acetoin dehydrogenase alpha subunit
MTRTSEESTPLLADQLALYGRMWVLRALDMALEELRIEGLIKAPVQSACGQEALGIGATAALSAGDITAATRRAHALHVGLNNPLGPTILEMIGRANNPEQWLSAGPAVTPSPLVLVGHAYSQWLDGKGRVTLCVVEDSVAKTDAFREAANMVALWHLPMVILVEEIRGGETSGHDSSAGHPMPGVSIDGNDVAAVRDSVAQAVQRARAGGGPTMVRAITYRTTAEEFVDPLIVAQQQLFAAGVTRDRLDEVEEVARELVADAVAFAEARF